MISATAALKEINDVMLMEEYAEAHRMAVSFKGHRPDLHERWSTYKKQCGSELLLRMNRSK